MYMTKRVKMRVNLAEARVLLERGEVVAVPTETVYGLAASLGQPEAIKKLFALKGRPLANPLIVHVSHWLEIAAYLDSFPLSLGLLADVFWPGPLTCVLPIRPSLIPEIARAGLTTAGFRIPSHPLTRKLLEQSGPLVMPSANLSGRPSATEASHVEEDFGSDFPVLDGGKCEKGVESTILVYRGEKWVVARLGAIAAEVFLPVLGYRPPLFKREEGQRPISPGQLFRHYAPRAALFLGPIPSGITHVIGFAERSYPFAKHSFILGSLFSPEEVAEKLYSTLRQLDIEKIEAAWVDTDFPRTGLWVTIAERLERAAQKNDELPHKKQPQINK